jgi:hypothetical protein
MCEDSSQLFRQENWFLHHNNGLSHTTFMTMDFFDQKRLSSSPTLLFSVLRLKRKLKGRHLDTTEVMEAESQAVLNVLKEDDFQDAFEEWQKRWERCIPAEGDYFEGGGGQ